MIEQLQNALATLAKIDEMRTKIGMALSDVQQMAISRKLAIDTKAFENWIASDEGRAALRALADTFIGLTPPARTIVSNPPEARMPSPAAGSGAFVE